MDQTNSKEKPLEQIHEVDIDDIELSHDNVRLSHATKDLDELAASIKRHGLLQPIVLIGEVGKPPYKLISGQRRFLAHKDILKRDKIRAVFTQRALSKTQAVVQSLVENLQRVELEYADIAKAVTFLYEKLGKDEENRPISAKDPRFHFNRGARHTKNEDPDTREESDSDRCKTSD